MMMMLDQNQFSSGYTFSIIDFIECICFVFSAMFHTIVTASGHKVSLTGLHLIATVTNEDEIEYKSAKDVKQGDILRVMSNGEVYSSVVNNVTIEVKIGFYAPLTLTGKGLIFLKGISYNSCMLYFRNIVGEWCCCKLFFKC